MMVTANLGWLILVMVAATLLCGCIGLWAGLRIGYMQGFIAAMNYDAIRGLGRADSQDQDGGNGNG